jgi:hypothetical protein
LVWARPFSQQKKEVIDMKFKTAAAAGVLALAPALALAQKVSYDFDKSATFGTYKTYQLKDGTKVGNPLIDDRIVAAIEAELATKGLTKTDANPDLTVVYHVAFDKKQDITAYSTGGGPYGWRWGGGMGGTTDVRVNEILVGTLVIDMADAKKGELVWRGMGTKQVDPQAKPEKRDKNIKEAVTKILKNYPPKSKT